MGQKVCPIGLRLGITKTWDSRWFAEKRKYSELLHEDLKIRDLIKKDFYQAAISKIELERAASERVRIIINSARPGMIIGRKGQEIEALRQRLSKMTGKDIYLDIREVKRPEIDAQLVAENIALQIKRRIAFRRAMKRAIASAMRLGALGIKIMVSGRLGGSEIARKEWYRDGRVPLATLRADIDYGFAEAKTTYGIIGIKVWVFKGEVLEKKHRQAV